MNKIIEFFAKEHLMGNLLTFMLLAFGVFSIFELRRDLYPNVNFETTIVSAVLPGASPEQIESLIINPIEESMREVDGIKRIISTATESTGILVAQLDPDSRDSTKTNRDIRRSIDTVDDYPEDAEDPVVREIEVSQVPVITVTVSKKGDFDNDLLTVGQYVYEQLSELKGVASVDKLGLRDEEIHIDVDHNKMNQRRIDLLQAIGAVKSQNISLPGGSALTKSNEEILIRTDAEYKSSQFLSSTSEENERKKILNQIKGTIIRSNDGGFSSKIGDIASVNYGLQDPEKLYKSFGDPAIHLVVKKKFNSDVLETVEGVRAKVKELQDQLGNRADLRLSNDLSTFVTNRLDILKSNLLVGLILVIIVLSLFLPWQATLVVAMGIPVALFSAMTVLYMAGNTINLISLVGLIIVLGMLVDDAIVVCENIWRHVEMQKPIQQAVIDGAKEVFVPVLGSVLTTVSAFAPMLFMTGIFGAFVGEIPFVVIVALFFSLFEAFIIMPSHFTSWVGIFIDQKKLKLHALKKESESSLFDRFVEKYKNFLVFTIRYRYLMSLVVALLMVGSIAIQVATGRFVLFPSDGLDFFFIHVEAPKSTSIEKMSHLIEPIEQEVSKLSKEELVDHTSTIGIIQQDSNDPQTRRGSNFANIRVILTPSKLRARTAQEIAEELKEKIGLPGGIERVKVEYPRAGPPQGRAVSINVMGKNFSQLQQIAENVKNELKNISGVSDIRDSFISGKDEWTVIPNQENMALVGLNANQVATTVRSAFEGIVASSIRDLDKEIDIRVRLENDSVSAQEKLNYLKIGNSLGNLIPLNQVASFEQRSTLNSILHKDFKRVINISADVDGIEMTGNKVARLVEPKVKEMSGNKRGYKIECGGEKEDSKE
ncbi:MAG: efflux RND transporter permease subunit [Bdellovibrionales bacterium]|nr:efflux RND transporter permease subunit [Bdellovibrionales bacterium]